MDRKKIKKSLMLTGLALTVLSIVGYMIAENKAIEDIKRECPPSGFYAEACMNAYFAPEGPGHSTGQVIQVLSVAFIVGVLFLAAGLILWLIDRLKNKAVPQQIGGFQFTGTQPVPVPSELHVNGANDRTNQAGSANFCPECGTGNESGQNFCNSCGSALG
ncbi:MAG: zinc ribbon domain-containing protein [Thermoleophilia bacterium]